MSCQENQQMLLDKKLTPLQKARKIMVAAYEIAGIQTIPSWLMTEQIEITGLQESIVDNKEAVLVAFKSMLIEKIRFIRIGDEKAQQQTIALITDDASRFVHLADFNLLSFARVLRDKGTRRDNGHYAINSGILTELYKYGVTKEQLPTLKSLANYMKADYKKSHGNYIIDVTKQTLQKYFEHDNNEDDNTADAGFGKSGGPGD